MKSLSPSQDLLIQILAIKSPTYSEQEMVSFFKDWANKNLPKGTEVKESRESLIFILPQQEGKKHLCFVGHSDVVPEHFEPRIDKDNMHGSGASDMKAGVACGFSFVASNFEALNEKYNLSLILYAREEMTALVDNGLYDLIQNFPEYFKSIDLAVVGEPTDNTVQLGCVGSIHALVTIAGKACHSARPWNGDNALYNALPFIEKMKSVEPVKHHVCGVDFFDVMQLTESSSEPGRTSLPGKWTANLNFRFAPTYTEQDAQKHLLDLVKSWNIPNLSIEIVNSVHAAKVVESDFFLKVVKDTGAEIQAKQAWTDVAQLAALDIPCFNFGPGFTSQAHVPDEYVSIKLINEYDLLLEKAFLSA